MNEQQQELYDKLLKKVNEYCLGQAAEDVTAAIDALVKNYESIHTTLCTVATELGEQVADNVNSKVVSMSKPLQALNTIDKVFRWTSYDDEGYTVATYKATDMCEEEFKIIETTLKEYESRKTLLENIDNNVIVFEPKEVWEEKQKKVKAIEIIKDKLEPYVEKYRDLGYTVCCNMLAIGITQEEYELLKEVLK